MKRSVMFLVFVFSLVCFIGLAYEVALDGAETVYRGFPVPWHSRVPVTSLAVEIYWVPLAIDLFFLVALGRFLFRSFGGVLGRRIIVLASLCCASLIIGQFAFHELFIQAWPSLGVFHITGIQMRW